MISADCATDYQSEVQRGRSQRCAGDRLLGIIGVEVNCLVIWLLFVGIIFIYVICWDNFIFVGGKKRKKIKDRKEKGKMSIVEKRRKRKRRRWGGK